MQQAAATYPREKIGRILIESRINDAALAGLRNRTEGGRAVHGDVSMAAQPDRRGYPTKRVVFASRQSG
jgi:hypothetical protein